MKRENAHQAKRSSGKVRHSRSKPNWQSHVVSTLFAITLLLVFGFFAQEGLRWFG